MLGGAGQLAAPMQRAACPKDAQQTAEVTGPTSHTLPLHSTSVPSHSGALRTWQTPDAQVRHSPLQASLQQMPLMQELLAHCALDVQASPASSRGWLQLPAASHRFVGEQGWFSPCGVALHSCAAEPQRPSTQRCAVTLCGKSRQVESAGQAIAPQAASSRRFSQESPVAAQRRQAPPQAAVQQTRPPAAVAWQLPAPQSSSELQASPAPPRQPPRTSSQPSAPHSVTTPHCRPLQR
jgi:hypothetical protein